MADVATDSGSSPSWLNATTTAALGSSQGLDSTVPAAMGPSPEQMEKAKEAYGDVLKKEEKTLDEASKFTPQYQQRMKDLVNAEGVTADDLKPWNMEGELAKNQTSIWEQFGSPAFIIAMLGSAFSANPMNAALTSGGAAIQASKDADEAKYKKAFDAWKENTDLTLKRLQSEHEQVSDLSDLQKTDIEQYNSRLRTILSKFGDDRKLALLNSGVMPDELSQSFSAQWKAAADLETAKTAIEDNELQRRAVWKLLGVDPSNPSSMKGVSPERIIAAKTAVEQMMQPGKTPEQQLWNQWTVEHPDASFDDRAAALGKIMQSVYAYRGTGNVATASDISSVKAELENTLGHPLDPEMNAAIDSALTAKGASASRVVGSVNRAIDEIKTRVANGESLDKINPDKLVNDALIAGSMTSGRSAATAFINKYQLEHPEASSDDVQKASALYTETMAKARTLGVRSGSVDVAVKEAQGAAKQALARSADIPRGTWVSLNRIQQWIKAGTSSPAMRRFADANAAFITAYAQTMSRTGTNTVTAQKRATELLDTADGQEAYAAGVDQLQTEMGIVQDAVRDVSAETAGEPEKSAPGGGAGDDGWGDLQVH